MTFRVKTRVPRRPSHRNSPELSRVIGRPDEFGGDPVKKHGLVVRTESILRSRGPAVSDGVEDDRSIVHTEIRRAAQLRGELSQHTDVPHTRDDNDRISIGQVSQCRHERWFRGQKTVRDGNGACWLLMNVLSTRLAAFERLVHKSQSSETVGDDTKTGVTVLGIEDMRVNAYLIQNSERIASWTQMREEIFETTRTQQCDSQHAFEDPRQGQGQQEQRQGQRQPGQRQKRGQGYKDRIVQEVEKAGHVWSQCGSRLKDLADAEERSVIANFHPNDTAAIVLKHCSLPDEYAMTFPMALPCGRRKTS